MNNKVSTIKKYGMKDIRRAMLMLRNNEFNINRTSIDTGYSRPTLRKWRDKFPQFLETDSIDACNNARVKNSFAIERIAVLKSSSRLLNDALKKASELIELETDLHKVNGTLKALSDLHKSITTPPEEDNAMDKINEVEKQIRELGDVVIQDADLVG